MSESTEQLITRKTRELLAVQVAIVDGGGYEACDAGLIAKEKAYIRFINDLKELTRYDAKGVGHD